MYIYHSISIILTSGGSKGGVPATLPSVLKFSQFYAAFLENWAKSYVGALPLGWRPLIWGTLDPPLIGDAKLKGTKFCQKNGLKMKEIESVDPRISVADPGFQEGAPTPWIGAKTFLFGNSFAENCSKEM